MMYGTKNRSEMIEYLSPMSSLSDCCIPATRATEMLVRSIRLMA